MVDLKSMNDNVISRRWKQRYAQQPDNIKKKLDMLDEMRVNDYQLQVIKRKKIYPEIGDIFELNPKQDMVLYGVVVNNHIKNINGEDLLVILIFRADVDVKAFSYEGIKSHHLLIPPQIVGREYWTKGYFHNINHIEEIKGIEAYGFFSISKGKFVDEYGNELVNEPLLLGTYGVATISGVARKINQELIIEGKI